MKNLLLIAFLCSIFTGTFTSANAQPSLKFINGVDFGSENIHGIGMIPPSLSPVVSLLSLSKPILHFATENCSKIQFKYALLLNTEIENIANLPLFEFIDNWWNTKYRFGGESKKGIDCSAFTGLLMSCVYAVRMPRTANQQYAATTRIKKEELVEGDLVFFHTRKGVSHVGAYLGDGFFVHASTSNGVTINNLSENYFSKRYIGGGRVSNNENDLSKF
ncbi:MAG: C40 family peptidase [Ferruginibacter sp.]